MPENSIRVLSYKNYRSLSQLFSTGFPTQNKSRAEDIILRILSAMGDFVLPLPLEIELNKLGQILSESRSNDTAKAVEGTKNKIKPTYWGAERTGNTSSINNYPGVSKEQHFFQCRPGVFTASAGTWGDPGCNFDEVELSYKCPCVFNMISSRIVFILYFYLL
ncbi:MAG TPA: hypothetical protein VGP47_05940 [Parachlamydiaceae bacterium]|nr:hypothetical protein [Parachlamydiaceae bacterium]